MLKQGIFSNFLKKIFANFRKFSQKFPANSVFRLNAQKLKTEFGKFFEKYSKNKAFLAIFLRNFFKTSENFLKISNKFCLSSKRAKLNAWFVKLFEKYAKIMRFWQFSLENFLKNFLQIAFFVQTRKNWMLGLFNFLKNMLKNLFLAVFLPIFLIFLNIFENFYKFF